MQVTEERGEGIVMGPAKGKAFKDSAGAGHVAKAIVAIPVHLGQITHPS